MFYHFSIDYEFSWTMDYRCSTQRSSHSQNEDPENVGSIQQSFLNGQTPNLIAFRLQPMLCCYSHGYVPMFMAALTCHKMSQVVSPEWLTCLAKSCCNLPSSFSPHAKFRNWCCKKEVVPPGLKLSILVPGCTSLEEVQVVLCTLAISEKKHKKHKPLRLVTGYLALFASLKRSLLDIIPLDKDEWSRHLSKSQNLGVLGQVTSSFIPGGSQDYSRQHESVLVVNHMAFSWSMLKPFAWLWILSIRIIRAFILDWWCLTLDKVSLLIGYGPGGNSDDLWRGPQFFFFLVNNTDCLEHWKLGFNCWFRTCCSVLLGVAYNVALLIFLFLFEDFANDLASRR